MRLNRHGKDTIFLGNNSRLIRRELFFKLCKADRGGWGKLVVVEVKTGLPCNAHTFRRTFASILAKRGVDSLHIQQLGRWESIAMVERYTRSVRFEDSLKLYSSIVV